MNPKETRKYLERQERLAQKLELERIRHENRMAEINARREARLKEIEEKRVSTENWLNKIRTLQENKKEQILTTKSPKMSRKEWNQFKKDQESDKFLEDIKEATGIDLKEVIEEAKNREVIRTDDEIH